MKMFRKKKEDNREEGRTMANTGCIVSSRIYEDGRKVGYMNRVEPSELFADSGWRFFQGGEDEAFSSNPGNFRIFSLESVCRMDEEVEPYLGLPVGTSLIRKEDQAFDLDDGTDDPFLTH